MLRFPVRPDALPLNPIWNFETTSNHHLILMLEPTEMIRVRNQFILHKNSATTNSIEAGRKGVNQINHIIQ